MEERAPSRRPEDGDDELRALARLLGDEGPRPIPNAAEAAADEDPTSIPAPDDPDAAANGAQERPNLDAAAQVPESTWAPKDEAGVPAEGSVPLIGRRFEIVECLGEGHHGTVFRTRDHAQQGREMAVKILHRSRTVQGPDGAAQLERARVLVESLAALTHDSVNRVREAGLTDDRRAWISSDLVEGENVRVLSERAGALPPRHAFEIARQVLLGLEAGHALGMVHGRVTADNVLLARRASWTEENPFGVAVRLTDFGLAPSLAPRTKDYDAERDLLAVAVLLADLLTGVRHAPDASDWIGAAGAASTSALSPPARRMLDRALARNPAERFGSARALRRAIEHTQEWRPARTKATSWRAAVIILLTGAAAGVAGLLLDTKSPLGSAGAASDDGPTTQPARGVAAAAPREPAAAPTEGSSAPGDVDARGSASAGDVPASAADGHGAAEGGAQLAALGAAPDIAEPEPAAASAGIASALEVLSTDLVRSRERIGALERESEELRARSESLASQRERERRESEVRAAELAAKLDQAQSELEALRDGTVPVPRAAARQAAALIDRWFEHLTDGALRNARAVAASFAQDEVLSRARVPGGEFLTGALDAIEALDQVERQDDPLVRLRLLPAAWQAVSRAETTGVTTLATEPAWAFDPTLDAPLEAGDEAADTPSRGRRVEDLIDALGARFSQVEGEVDQQLEWRWDELLRDPTRDPAEVAFLAEHFGDGRLPAFVERFALHATAVATGDPGNPNPSRLDWRALRDLTTVAHWAAILRSAPERGRWEDVQSVLELDFARVFAIGGAALDYGRLPAIPARLREHPADGSWRERLALRAGLLDDDIGLPGRIGGRYLHFGRTVEGEASWRWDTVRHDPTPPSDTDASRLVDQRFYDGDGNFLMERSLRVLRIGMRVFEEDARRNAILDLSNFDLDFEVRSWKPGPSPEPPARLFVPPDGQALFRHRLTEENARCLVLQIASARTWWTPELGLVRHADTSRITRELVYAELPD